MNDDEIISVAPLVVQQVTNGRFSESPVSNAQYLESYVRYLGWIRVWSAYKCLLTLEHTSNDSVAHVAAVAELSEQNGKFMEDVASLLIAMSAWGAQRQLAIADLLKGLSIKNNDDRAAQGYHETSLQALISRGRATVNPRQFLASMGALPFEEQARTLGIVWPDVATLVADPEEAQRRQKLRESIELVRDYVGQGINQLVATTYNKIKHGPQAIAYSMRQIALARGCDQPIVDHFAEGHIHLRLLFEGARTQEVVAERDASPPRLVAPFVPDDMDNVTRTVLRMFVIASSMQSICMFLLGRVLEHHFEMRRDPEFSLMLSDLMRRIQALPSNRPPPNARHVNFTLV